MSSHWLSLLLGSALFVGLESGSVHAEPPNPALAAERNRQPGQPAPRSVTYVGPPIEAEADGDIPFERWFVEAGVSLRIGRDDTFTDTLRKFDFEDFQPGYDLSPQLAVGAGVSRHVALLARAELLEERKFERSLYGPTTSPDAHAFSWSTWSAALGLRVRLPLLREYLVPYAELDVGLGIARSEYRRRESSRTEYDFALVMRAGVGFTVHMFWRLGCYLSGGYDYAPVLKNDLGDARDSGGFYASAGLRLRGLTGGTLR